MSARSRRAFSPTRAARSCTEAYRSRAPVSPATISTSAAPSAPANAAAAPPAGAAVGAARAFSQSVTVVSLTGLSMVSSFPDAW